MENILKERVVNSVGGLIKNFASINVDYNILNAIDWKIVDESDIRKTLLYEKLDIEVYTVKDTPRITRIGGFIDLNLEGASPVSTVLDRLVKMIGGSWHEKIESDDSDDDYQDYEYPLYYIDNNRGWNLGIATSEFKRFRFSVADTVEKGKSMFNRKADRYAWYNATGSIVPIDREWAEVLKFTPPKKCLVCGKELLIGSYTSICPVCATTHNRCSICDGFFPTDKLKAVRGRVKCEECMKLKSCDCCGRTLESGSTSKVCDECRNYEGRFQYHSGMGRRDQSGDSRFKLGIEVEKEDASIKVIPLGQIVDESGWVVEEDGSLNRSIGFELISPIYPLDEEQVYSRIKNCEVLEKLINAKCTRKCGGHLHVSDTERTPSEILLDIRGYLPLLYSMYPSRATNEYCEAKETKEYLERGHRQAINPGDRTLEFRVFPAVDNAEQLLFRIRLVRYMLENPCRDTETVGKQLLDPKSELYKLLIERISPKSLSKKARAFIDFSNYIERDSLAFKGGTIERLLTSQNKFKREEDKRLEERVKQVSSRVDRRPLVDLPVSPISIIRQGDDLSCFI